jgi:hypothetical protein
MDGHRIHPANLFLLDSTSKRFPSLFSIDSLVWLFSLKNPNQSPLVLHLRRNLTRAWAPGVEKKKKEKKRIQPSRVNLLGGSEGEGDEGMMQCL